MRKTCILLGLLVLCLTPFAGRSDNGQLAASDEQAIRKAIVYYTDVLNKQNLHCLMSFWAANAEYIDEKGTNTQGWTAIKELFKHHLSGLKGAKVEFKTTSTRQMSPDVVLQDGAAKLSLADGTIDHGRFAAVWSKKNGKCQLHSVRDLPAEVGATDAAAGPLQELKWMVGDWQADNVGMHVSVRWGLNHAFLTQDHRLMTSSYWPTFIS
jgi:ketosteroid isomerase-like protein